MLCERSAWQVLVNAEDIKQKVGHLGKGLIVWWCAFSFWLHCSTISVSAVHKFNNLYVNNQLLCTVSVALNMRNIVIRSCSNISYYLFFLTLYAYHRTASNFFIELIFYLVTVGLTSLKSRLYRKSLMPASFKSSRICHRDWYIVTAFRIIFLPPCSG